MPAVGVSARSARLKTNFGKRRTFGGRVTVAGFAFDWEQWKAVCDDSGPAAVTKGTSAGAAVGSKFAAMKAKLSATFGVSGGAAEHAAEEGDATKAALPLEAREAQLRGWLELRRVAGMSQDIVLRLSNTAEPVQSKQARAKHAERDRWKWKISLDAVFVGPELDAAPQHGHWARPDAVDATAFIDQVVFELHPSFSPNRPTVWAPPFEVERVGWGMFEIAATVHFLPSIGAAPLTLKHTLSFDGPHAVGIAYAPALPKRSEEEEKYDVGRAEEAEAARVSKTVVGRCVADVAGWQLLGNYKGSIGQKQQQD